MRGMSGVFVLVLVALVVALTPAAFADPPDPTWIGGYWDDDDFDNVALFIASTCAAVTATAFDWAPADDAAGRVEPRQPGSYPVVLRSSARPRAPPVSAPSV